YNLYLSEIKSNLKYQYPKAPQKLSNYDPSIQTTAYRSEWVDYSKKDTILKVGNKTYEGMFVYSELEVVNTGELEMWIEGEGHILLFSGHISNGNISLLQNIDYTELYRKVTFTNYDHPKYKKCFYLNKGKYTVVCLML